jgi:hypothetical protein
MAQLSVHFSQPINITMNERHIDIVARNVIMLLIALTTDQVDEAVDAIIHVWYSVLIRESDLSFLQKQVRPLIEAVCEKIRGKKSDKVLGKTWTFGQRSLRLELQKSSWDELLSFMDVPVGLTREGAHDLRTAVTLAESRKDYVDRNMLLQPPFRRVAKQKYREDGILLPFGSPRDEFHVPNP